MVIQNKTVFLRVFDTIELTFTLQQYDTIAFCQVPLSNTTKLHVTSKKTSQAGKNHFKRERRLRSAKSSGIWCHMQCKTVYNVGHMIKITSLRRINRQNCKVPIPVFSSFDLTTIAMTSEFPTRVSRKMSEYRTKRNMCETSVSRA